MKQKSLWPPERLCVHFKQKSFKGAFVSREITPRGLTTDHKETWTYTPAVHLESVEIRLRHLAHLARRVLDTSPHEFEKEHGCEECDLNDFLIKLKEDEYI